MGWASVVQAGSLPLADLTPDEAVTFEVRPNIFWRGLPPAEAAEALAAHANQPIRAAE